MLLRVIAKTSGMFFETQCRVAKSNGDVRILMGSWEIAAFRHMRTLNSAKKAKTDWPDLRRPQVAMHSQFPTVYSLSFDVKLQQYEAI